MIGQISDDIENWLYKVTDKKDLDGISAIGRVFGIVIMEDGRQAQVQLNLEMDKEEWRDA
jgi:hypothetical protein